VHPAQSVVSFYPVILASFLAGDNNAGGEYGLADKYPVSFKKSGVFYYGLGGRRGFMPIRIRRQDKNTSHTQVSDTMMLMIEKL